MRQSKKNAFFILINIFADKIKWHNQNWIKFEWTELSKKKEKIWEMFLKVQYINLILEFNTKDPVYILDIKEVL